MSLSNFFDEPPAFSLKGTVFCRRQKVRAPNLLLHKLGALDSFAVLSTTVYSIFSLHTASPQNKSKHEIHFRRKDGFIVLCSLWH